MVVCDCTSDIYDSVLLTYRVYIQRQEQLRERESERREPDTFLAGARRRPVEQARAPDQLHIGGPVPPAPARYGEAA